MSLLTRTTEMARSRIAISINVQSMDWFRLVLLLCALLLVIGCEKRPTDHATGSSAPVETEIHARTVSNRRESKYPRKLSEYNLFVGDIVDLKPSEGVVEYRVNTPLFSDYSEKQRLIRLPAGTSAKYQAFDVFDFPVGTIIAKTFYYSHDVNAPSKGRRLVETRILQHTESGWVGIPYVWNEGQTEATLAIAGATVAVEWIHRDGSPRSNAHLVPNMNDCKRCHQNERMEPIGPKARSLNGEFTYTHGTENQLAFWTRSGLLTGSPSPESAPKLAVWDDPETGTLDQRARAWLDVNCAHCHNPRGPSRNSGLFYNLEVTDLYQLGVDKTPVAAGPGGGGRKYDIVPGNPDASIMLYRIESTHSGAMMPEFGRSLVQEEAVQLIRAWIAEM